MVSPELIRCCIQPGFGSLLIPPVSYPYFQKDVISDWPNGSLEFINSGDTIVKSAIKYGVPKIKSDREFGGRC